MKLYTIGFTQKSAETFFGLIRKAQADLLIDIRLNNQSQLAGFTKGKDLAFFLKEIAGCDYVHDTVFSPTKSLLDAYKKGSASWEDYVRIFHQLIEDRDMVGHFTKEYTSHENVVLLCSEPTPEQCHRRLVAEAIAQKTDVEIIHL